MAECIYCKAETQLFVSSIPVCLKCSEERETQRKPPKGERDARSALLQDILEATFRRNEANREFEDVMDQFPSGLPHPDGSQRIKNASAKLSTARKEMMTAHARLNDFIEHGIVPEDLKRNAG